MVLGKAAVAADMPLLAGAVGAVLAARLAAARAALARGAGAIDAGPILALAAVAAELDAGRMPDAHPPDLSPGRVTTLCFREVGASDREGRLDSKTGCFCPSMQSL